MKTYIVTLLHKDAKYNDLYKFLLSYANAQQGTNIPGVSSLIGFLEDLIKNAIGGLPVNLKVKTDANGVSFIPTWETKVFMKGVEDINVPFADIIDVELVKDEWLSVLYFPRKVRKILLKTVNGNITFAHKITFFDKSEEIQQGIIAGKGMYLK